MERKVSYFNITFDHYTSIIHAVMHDILVTSYQYQYCSVEFNNLDTDF